MRVVSKRRGILSRKELINKMKTLHNEGEEVQWIEERVFFLNYQSGGKII